MGQLGGGADTNACLWLAYLRWLGTQGVPLPPSAPVQPPRWIDSHEVLKHRRAPGSTVLSGLASGEMGTVYRPVNPESKGCGTVMRSAPFGLIPYIAPESVYKLSADAASLTHGHPSARQSSGRPEPDDPLPDGRPRLREAADYALGHLRAGNLGRNESPDPALLERLEGALRLAAQPGEPAAGGLLSPEELVRELGEGWVAEEALAVAFYAVLATAPARDGGGCRRPEAHFRAAIASR